MINLNISYDINRSNTIPCFKHFQFASIFACFLLCLLFLFSFFNRNKFASLDELAEHLVSYFWLIHRYHVTCIVHFKEGEVFELLDLSVNLETHFWVCGCRPLLESLLVKIFLMVPDKCCSPGITSFPIADKVFITVIDQNWKTFIQKLFQVIAIVILVIES